MRFNTIFWSFGSGLLFWATLYSHSIITNVLLILTVKIGGNSLDKLRHTWSVAYFVELVLLKKHQISGGGAYLDCYNVWLFTNDSQRGIPSKWCHCRPGRTRCMRSYKTVCTLTSKLGRHGTAGNKAASSKIPAKPALWRFVDVKQLCADPVQTGNEIASHTLVDSNNNSNTGERGDSERIARPAAQWPPRVDVRPRRRAITPRPPPRRRALAGTRGR